MIRIFETKEEIIVKENEQNMSSNVSFNNYVTVLMWVVQAALELVQKGRAGKQGN